jgi:hypothetical protein
MVQPFDRGHRRYAGALGLGALTLCEFLETHPPLSHHFDQRCGAVEVDSFESDCQCLSADLFDHLGKRLMQLILDFKKLRL